MEPIKVEKSEEPVTKIIQEPEPIEEMEIEPEPLNSQPTIAKPQHVAAIVDQQSVVDDRDVTVHLFNERGDLVYRRPVEEPSQPMASFDDEDPSFFELTENEVRKMMAELIQKYTIL